MDEKASIMVQFEQLARERQKVNDELRPFHQENDQIRVQINEFSERRAAITVRRCMHCIVLCLLTDVSPL